MSLNKYDDHYKFGLNISDREYGCGWGFYKKITLEQGGQLIKAANFIESYGEDQNKPRYQNNGYSEDLRKYTREELKKLAKDEFDLEIEFEEY